MPDRVTLHLRHSTFDLFHALFIFLLFFVDILQSFPFKFSSDLYIRLTSTIKGSTCDSFNIAPVAFKKFKSVAMNIFNVDIV